MHWRLLIETNSKVPDVNYDHVGSVHSLRFDEASLITERDEKSGGDAQVGVSQLTPCTRMRE